MVSSRARIPCPGKRDINSLAPQSYYLKRLSFDAYFINIRLPKFGKFEKNVRDSGSFPFVT